MKWFPFSSKDDEYKVDLKTAKLISESVEEHERACKEKEEEDLAKAVELSLKELEKVESEKLKDKDKTKEEDEKLPKSHKETFKDKRPKMHPKDDLKVAVNPPAAASICDRGKSVIEDGKSVNPQALCCQVCHEPFKVDEIPKRKQYHERCFKHRKKCNVCEEELPLNEERKRIFNCHPFWKKNYCPVHDKDGTPKCCSCERLQPQGESTYVVLEDGRWLCLECMEYAYMAWDECQHLQFEIRDYFCGLNMEITKEFHFLLVEQQALNEAEKKEKTDQRNYKAVTRGICLSEEQFVDSVTKKPVKGPNNKLIGMAKESVWVERRCEVTGILILYGLPRLLTGYILAHEMMHAYLRLNGHSNLDEVLEEGLCQVLGHMWLESQTYTAADATLHASAAAASSSSHTPADSASKKGANSEFEKKLVDFFKDQIETDKTKVYGRGFRIVNEMVTNSSLPETLQAIIGGRINP